MITDLPSLNSVRELASHIVDTYPRLDILINNAGIGIADRKLNYCYMCQNLPKSSYI